MTKYFSKKTAYFFAHISLYVLLLFSLHIYHVKKVTQLEDQIFDRSSALLFEAINSATQNGSTSLSKESITTPDLLQSIGYGYLSTLQQLKLQKNEIIKNFKLPFQKIDFKKLESVYLFANNGTLYSAGSKKINSTHYIYAKKIPTQFIKKWQNAEGAGFSIIEKIKESNYKFIFSTIDIKNQQSFLKDFNWDIPKKNLHLNYGVYQIRNHVFLNNGIFKQIVMINYPLKNYTALYPFSVLLGLLLCFATGCFLLIRMES